MSLGHHPGWRARLLRAGRPDIAGTAHRLSPWLKRVGRRFNQACGGVFVAIGALLPLRA